MHFCQNLQQWLHYPQCNGCSMAAMEVYCLALLVKEPIVGSDWQIMPNRRIPILTMAFCLVTASLAAVRHQLSIMEGAIRSPFEPKARHIQGILCHWLLQLNQDFLRTLLQCKKSLVNLSCLSPAAGIKPTLHPNGASTSLCSLSLHSS